MFVVLGGTGSAVNDYLANITHHERVQYGPERFLNDSRWHIDKIEAEVLPTDVASARVNLRRREKLPDKACALECLFDPALANREGMGVLVGVQRLLQDESEEVVTKLLRNVITFGGSTGARGFDDRLKRGIEAAFNKDVHITHVEQWERVGIAEAIVNSGCFDSSLHLDTRTLQELGLKGNIDPCEEIPGFDGSVLL